MSTTAEVAEPPTSESTARRVIRQVAVTAGARWLLLLACTFVAFAHTWRRIVQETADGMVIGYVFVVPLLAVIAAQGIARRSGSGLPIHDRQTDNIVGGVGLVASVAIEALWLPRYATQYELSHLDILAVLVFALSGSILLFGLRPVGRFWPVWILLFAMNPLAYRIVAIEFGGSRFAYGMVLLFAAGVACAIAVGRSLARAAAGFASTVLVGVVLLWSLLLMWPDAHVVVVQLVPTLVATILTASVFFVVARRGRTMNPLQRPVVPLSAKSVRSSAVALVAAAVAIFFLPLPAPDAKATVAGPGGSAGVPFAAPVGWQILGEEEFDWVRSFFGENANLLRQTMRAESGSPKWDVQARPRRIVVDTLTTNNPATFAVYPEPTLYELANTRTSRALRVNLGHDMTGLLYTSVSDELLLTWTKLVFTWTREDATQRVTVISVDNHEADATFPLPTPSMASNLATTVQVFLRGNRIATNEDPDFKDLDLLTDFGTKLIAAQFESAGPPR